MICKHCGQRIEKRDGLWHDGTPMFSEVCWRKYGKGNPFSQHEPVVNFELIQKNPTISLEEANNISVHTGMDLAANFRAAFCEAFIQNYIRSSGLSVDEIEIVERNSSDGVEFYCRPKRF